MSNVKRLLLALLAAALIGALHAAEIDANERGLIAKVRSNIQEAQLQNKPELFESTAKLLEAGLQAYPKSGLLLYYNGYLLYLESTLLKGPGLLAKIKAADEALAQSIAQQDMPDTHALRAFLISRMLALRPKEMMPLLQQSSAEMAKAIELGPENPRVWLIKGMNTLFTPASFGGGPDKAMRHFAKAEKLFQRKAAGELEPNWGKDEVYAWIGICHAKLGDEAKALTAYKEALNQHSHYPWVQFVLMPNLAEKKDPFAERPPPPVPDAATRVSLPNNG